jgi:hydrogenase nickel incorporation protein HypA/HybF
MHEVSLMQQALDIALERANDNGGTRIHRLTIRIGPLAGVVTDALRFAFDVVAQGTPAEGAEFVIEDVPIQCWCNPCSREFEPSDYVFRCPTCAQITDDVRHGREFDLASMEVS